MRRVHSLLQTVTGNAPFDDYHFANRLRVGEGVGDSFGDAHVLRDQRKLPVTQALHEFVDIVGDAFFGIVAIGGAGTVAQSAHIGRNHRVLA